MKDRPQPISSWLFRTCAAVTLLALLMAGGATLYAQGSVEKSQTSQQAKEPVNELERAKMAVAKPNEPRPQPETGRMWGDYSTTSSIEVGYRFVDTDGDRQRYLSDVNVRPGLRLLDYSLDMRARPGAGLLFDSLRTEFSNVGGDQGQYFSLRADKTRAYRFDAKFRRFNYYRSIASFVAPIPNTTWREHDLRQQATDYSLKLFPQRAVRINLGYGRSMAKGRFTPTYSFQRDLFQLLGESQWEANDYRLGLDATYRGWDFQVEQSYRHYRNDPAINAKPGGDQGANLASPTAGAISFLERDTPLRGRALMTRGSVRGSFAERLHILLRGVYSTERLRTPYLETASGTNQNNAKLLSNVLTANGAVKRPSSVFDAGATLDIAKNIALSNTFRYFSYRILGDVISQTTSVTQTGTAAPVTSVSGNAGNRLTDVDSYWNTLELNYSRGKKFSTNLGWRVMKRDVRLLSNFVSGTSAPIVADETESETTHAFVGGARFRPTNRMSFIFDMERGTSNNVFTRIDPFDYLRIRVRTQVQASDTLSFNGSFTSTDRTNPTPQVENESDFRSYTVGVNWAPKSRLWVDVGYDYHDLFSTANIRYVSGVERRAKGLYYGRMHSVYVNSRLGLTEHLDLLLTYYYIMDRGAPAVTVGPDDLLAALPLKRHNPEVRLAYRFNNHITGNLSYRHYSFNERDFSVQDYRSNILTTSVRFTF